MPKDRTPVPPPDFPVTPPPQLPSADYSYTVELVGSIQNQLGRLTEAIESLKEQTKEHGKELKTIGNDVHATKVSVKVAAWLIGIFMALLTLGWTIGWAIITKTTSSPR